MTTELEREGEGKQVFKSPTDANIFYVKSASNPGGFHIVRLEAKCDCEGFKYRLKCRHIRHVFVEAAKEK